MPPNKILILSYILFIWMVILHTFEEIASGIMGEQIGPIKLTRKKYLLGASLISTLNLGTLALLVFDLTPGYYIGLFTSAVIGMFQALAHTVGYLRGGGQARGLGAGFYSSIPLAVVGLLVFVQIIRILIVK
jgi:hypothetical protein